MAGPVTRFYPRFSGKASTLPSGNAETACQLVIVIGPQNAHGSQMFFDTNPTPVDIPQAQAWGFDGEC